MTQYAYFNSAVAAPSPVIGWFDTEFAAFPNLPPASDLLTVTPTQWAARMANPSGWAVSNGALVAYTPPPPVLTLAQQATAALGAGLTITSTNMPSLNGTYACDDAAQARINRVYALIQRVGGAAFPASMTSLPWPDKSGALHTFTSVAEFLAFETAIGDYVLALDMIQATNSGTLPSSTANIA